MATKLLKNALFIFFISVNTLFSQNEKYHIIKKGETLYSISKNYNISVNYLKKINNLNSNSLSIGQRIIIEIIEDNNELNSVTNREEGFASTIEDNTSSDKYLALHKTATIGTIIFVKNQMNDNVVIVRVIGALPNTGINDKINIKLSRVAFEKLDAKDDIIPVELTYVKEEIKY
ncbi:MAG: LysM peptidoglycan-binding domain-containing protein [Bacteroidota bacterium]|nr:LysM peptidoglycan-binding domain-containing protein [Bacteroidota bacterium]